ncbi:hypothetical protein EFE21_00660 [Lactococcus lactis subsp. lactis]|nr:hypothetical protein [Lactococcus lactis subsp. lactis]MCT0066944.1 hypothetical protein [Lactococcus lactis subsp. lactis]
METPTINNTRPARITIRGFFLGLFLKRLIITIIMPIKKASIPNNPKNILITKILLALLLLRLKTLLIIVLFKQIPN